MSIELGKASNRPGAGCIGSTNHPCIHVHTYEGRQSDGPGALAEKPRNERQLPAWENETRKDGGGCKSDGPTKSANNARAIGNILTLGQ